MRKRGTRKLSLVHLLWLSILAPAQPAWPATPGPVTAIGAPPVNLSGVWTAGTRGNDDFGADIREGNAVTVGLPSRDGGLYTLEIDEYIRGRASRDMPLYKPEHWPKIREYSANGLRLDPRYKCQSLGVPRIGPPHEIIQTAERIVFLYTNPGHGGQFYRVIPIGQPHNERRVLDETLMGDSIGRWEGSTLVIETIGLSSESWLASYGYFHSDKTRVVERLTRSGNRIKYDVTVFDPEVFIEPWVMNSREVVLNQDPHAMLNEEWPCSERDNEEVAKVAQVH